MIKVWIIRALVVLLFPTGATAYVWFRSWDNRQLSGTTTARILNPIGPSLIPVAGIRSREVQGKIGVDIQYWKTFDEVTALLSKDNDRADFAVLPVTTGVNLNSNGCDLDLVAVHVWNVFSLMASADSDFSGWRSLAGKTIYVSEGRGQTVDILTRYALRRENLTPDKDVTFVYAPPQEIIALLKAGRAQYAALPEPFVTQAITSGKSRIALDYHDYWSQATNSTRGIPAVGLFVKRAYAAKHQDTVAAVAATVATSTQWANDHPDDAIKVSSEVLPLPPEVVRDSLSRIQFEYVSAQRARDDVMTFLLAMRRIYPEGVRTIPSEEFFR